jgi:hypothetical protein
MESPSDLRHLYRELADSYAERGQPQFRDRFLVLAAAAALTEGDGEAAERYRQRLLAVNPHHLLKPYSSFAQAIEMPDVQTYVHDQQQNYPPHVAQSLLDSLRDVKEPDHRPIPVTAPLLNLDSGPDLLMDDDNEPLKLFSFRDDPPSAIPPTLPPNKFPAAPAAAAHRTPNPQTLYDAEAPQPLPPAPRANLARANKLAPLPQPVASNTPPPRTSKATPSLPVSATISQEFESETSGAWLCTLLFGMCAGASIGLAWYVLAAPLLLPR